MVNESGLTEATAKRIIARLGESGQPPEVGIHHVNVGNESLLLVLDQEYLLPMADSGRGSSFKLVEGQFGSGKTHFLYCLRERAYRRGFLASLVTLSPEECPFDAPRKIYAAVARELTYPPADSETPASRGMEIALGDFLQEKIEASSREEVASWVTNELKRIPVDSLAYRTAVRRYLQAWLSEDEEELELSAAYLRGEEIPLSELRLHGIREEIRKDNAFRMLRSLCQVAHGLGSPGILLAFDEGDRNLSFTPKRRRAIADNLRMLIDYCGQEALPGVLCLYAVPPEFMNKVVPEYVALQQRLQAPSALSVRSPQAILIDLEQLDLPPIELLERLGGRLLVVYSKAYDLSLNDEVQRTNIRLLAEAVIASSWMVAHRRAFVKAVIHLFHQQRVEEILLDANDAAEIVRIGGRAELVSAGEDGFADF